MSYGKAFCLIFHAIICTTRGGGIQLVEFSAGNFGSSHGFQRWKLNFSRWHRDLLVITFDKVLRQVFSGKDQWIPRLVIVVV